MDVPFQEVVKVFWSWYILKKKKSISVLLKQFLEQEILAVKTLFVIIPESQI